MSDVFQTVALESARRGTFDLSHSHVFTCDMGQLIPCCLLDVMPSDFFDIMAEGVIRFMPMVAPPLHQIDATIHFWFVPNRLLDDDTFEWEEFITGGVAGDDASTLPRWIPDGGNVTNANGTVVADNGIGSLWDYMGFPTGVIPTGAFPDDRPKRAYNLIRNEFYRDQNLMTEVDITTSEIVFNRCWEKDYFTSALENQQRGTAPALPVSGTLTAVFQANEVQVQAKNSGAQWRITNGATTGAANVNGSGADDYLRVMPAHLAAQLADNEIDADSLTTFDIADMRLANAAQRFLETNQRIGARYSEVLRGRFGVEPQDARLDRPEYIGGVKFPVIISEVLQTSKTDGSAAQGNLAGHGLVAGVEKVGKFRAPEHGVILGILSVMPKAMYQQGINRQWLKESKYDWYTPEFADISEQAIRRAEIYASGVEAENDTIFGYQGAWDEHRVMENKVCGLMRTDFDHWHLGRQFASAPALNEAFVVCIPRKDFLAAPTQPSMVVHIGNKIIAKRPLPQKALPRLGG